MFNISEKILPENTNFINYFFMSFCNYQSFILLYIVLLLYFYLGFSILASHVVTYFPDLVH